MRHLIKYFLVAAIIASGFYAARPFRRLPPPLEDGDNTRSTQPLASSGSSAAAESPVPVAALIDTDRKHLIDTQARGTGFGHIRDNWPSAVPKPATIEGSATASPTNSERPLRVPIEARLSRPDQQRSASASENTLTPDPQEKELSIPHLAKQYKPLLDRLREQGSAFSDMVQAARTAMAHENVVEQATAPEKSPQRWESGYPSSQPESLQRKSATQQAIRQHVVVEGDTLPEIASTYLGDRTRYSEIYEANRDVLPDARLLPIGVQLRIPLDAQADNSNGPPSNASKRARRTIQPRDEAPGSEDGSEPMEPIPADVFGLSSRPQYHPSPAVIR